ncbi:MAG: glycosyltransferase family 4 protein [Candidatus Margulisiibacteriota bacterium]
MKKINIILDHKVDTSITRIAVMYANQLAANGFQVTVNYPIFPWYRYILFRNNIEVGSLRFKYMLMKRLVSSFIKKDREWEGAKNHNLAKAVRLNSYLYKPTINNIPDADFILIFQGQLLLDLIVLPKEKGEIIDSLHISDFQDDPILREWYGYLLETVWKRIKVRRFAVSTMAKEYFEGQGVRVEGTVHNGVNLTEFRPNEYEEKDSGILMFSDVKRQKGYDFGLKVINALKMKNVKNKFYSIGRVGKEMNVSVFDKAYGYLTGEDYSRLYRRHLFFLYPSLFDGFPAPPLEAMASGAVCVLAKVAGVGEYAVDGENCMLCEPGDLNGFVNKFHLLLNDPELCRKISQNAVNTAKKYSWENVTRKLIEFISNENERG